MLHCAANLSSALWKCKLFSLLVRYCENCWSLITKQCWSRYFWLSFYPVLVWALSSSSTSASCGTPPWASPRTCQRRWSLRRRKDSRPPTSTNCPNSLERILSSERSAQYAWTKSRVTHRRDWFPVAITASISSAPILGSPSTRFALSAEPFSALSSSTPLKIPAKIERKKKTQEWWTSLSSSGSVFIRFFYSFFRVLLIETRVLCRRRHLISDE